MEEKSYVVFLEGDGGVTLFFSATDERDAERQAYDWIKTHNYNGDVSFIDEIKKPEEVEI